MLDLLHRALAIGAVAVGLALSALWTGFLGYGLFWLTATALEWSVE